MPVHILASRDARARLRNGLEVGMVKMMVQLLRRNQSVGLSTSALVLSHICEVPCFAVSTAIIRIATLHIIEEVHVRATGAESHSGVMLAVVRAT